MGGRQMASGCEGEWEFQKQRPGAVVYRSLRGRKEQLSGPMQPASHWVRQATPRGEHRHQDSLFPSREAFQRRRCWSYGETRDTKEPHISLQGVSQSLTHGLLKMFTDTSQLGTTGGHWSPRVAMVWERSAWSQRQKQGG